MMHASLAPPVSTCTIVSTLAAAIWGGWGFARRKSTTWYCGDYREDGLVGDEMKDRLWDDRSRDVADDS